MICVLVDNVPVDKKDLNLAQITSPLPLNVEVALQCK